MDTELEFDMMEDQEYLLLMSTIARAQTIPENPIVAGRFVSKVINLHIQAATAPEAPAKTPHNESDDETEHLANPTNSAPYTSLMPHHNTRALLPISVARVDHHRHKPWSRPKVSPRGTHRLEQVPIQLATSTPRKARTGTGHTDRPSHLTVPTLQREQV